MTAHSSVLGLLLVVVLAFAEVPRVTATSGGGFQQFGPDNMSERTIHDEARIMGGLTTYAINSSLYNSTAGEVLLLTKYFCSKGAFVLAPAPMIRWRSSSSHYSFDSSGWTVKAADDGLSCSVIYTGQKTGYTIRFAFESMANSACWAVWQADGSDINYPLASSWTQYVAGPRMFLSQEDMDIRIYNLWWGPPVKQGIRCAGN